MLAKFRSKTGKKFSSNDRSVPKNHRNVKDFGEKGFSKSNLIGEDSETFVAESDSF